MLGLEGYITFINERAQFDGVVFIVYADNRIEDRRWRR